MWLNYFKSAIRNLLTRKLLFAINILCLSFAFSILLFAYYLISHELSYDKFLNTNERVFRVDMLGLGRNQSSGSSFFAKWQSIDENRNVLLPPQLIVELENSIPEIESVCRLNIDRKYIVEYNEKKFLIEGVILADTSFFNIFNFPLISGSRSTLLRSPSDVVITESIAKKYFGNKDALNEIISIDVGRSDYKSFTVSGIVEDPPSNSSLQFSMLIPFAYPAEVPPNINWSSLNYLFTLGIIKVKANTDIHSINKKLTQFVRSFYKEEIAARGINENGFGLKATIFEDTHLDEIAFGWPNQGSALNLYILSVISIVILFVAATNYSLLQITNSAGRVNEIGVRKTFGALPSSIFIQFMIESFVLSALATMIAIIFSIMLLPAASDLIDVKIDLNAFDYEILIGGILLFFVLVGILVGFYPSLFLSKYKIAHLINSSKTYRIKPTFSGVVVTVQYVICFIFLICIAIIEKQFQYIEEKDLGFAAEDILTIDLQENSASGDLVQLVQRYRDLAAADANIHTVSAGYSIIDPGVTITSNDDKIPVFELRGDYHYAALYNFTLIEGRYPPAGNIQGSEGANEKRVVINETLAKAIYPCKVGQPCAALNNYIIEGIVKDFNFQPLSKKIAPAYYVPDASNVTTIAFKVNPSNVNRVQKEILEIWRSHQDDKPLILKSLKAQINALYSDHYQWGMIIKSATVVALVISLFGLFGLSALNSMNAKKQVAIKKVLGAGLFEILSDSYKSIFKVIAVSFLVAVPVSVYLMNKWLQNFEYHTSITLQPILLSLIVGLLLSVISSSYFIIRTVYVNPSKILRQ